MLVAHIAALIYLEGPEKIVDKLRIVFSSSLEFMDLSVVFEPCIAELVVDDEDEVVECSP